MLVAAIPNIKFVVFIPKSCALRQTIAQACSVTLQLSPFLGILSCLVVALPSLLRTVFSVLAVTACLQVGLACPSSSPQGVFAS